MPAQHFGNYDGDVRCAVPAFAAPGSTARHRSGSFAPSRVGGIAPLTKNDRAIGALRGTVCPQLMQQESSVTLQQAGAATERTGTPLSWNPAAARANRGAHGAAICSLCSTTPMRRGGKARG